jgi:hypothetical protein
MFLHDRCVVCEKVSAMPKAKLGGRRRLARPTLPEQQHRVSSQSHSGCVDPEPASAEIVDEGLREPLELGQRFRGRPPERF